MFLYKISYYILFEHINLMRISQVLIIKTISIQRMYVLTLTYQTLYHLDRPESVKASDAVEDRREGVAASGNKSRNILPVLMKMKQRGSLVRQEKMS